MFSGFGHEGRWVTLAELVEGGRILWTQNSYTVEENHKGVCEFCVHKMRVCPLPQPRLFTCFPPTRSRTSSAPRRDMMKHFGPACH